VCLAHGFLGTTLIAEGPNARSTGKVSKPASLAFWKKVQLSRNFDRDPIKGGAIMYTLEQISIFGEKSSNLKSQFTVDLADTKHGRSGDGSFYRSYEAENDSEVPDFTKKNVNECETKNWRPNVVGCGSRFFCLKGVNTPTSRV